MSEVSTTGKRQESEEGYAEFERIIRDRISSIGTEPIFTTDVTGLWELYLNNLPEDRRQHYNCHCCRRFIERYGSLVKVQEDGTTQSILWNTFSVLWDFFLQDVPSLFIASIHALRYKVERARVTGVFIWNESTWGTPKTGDWTHLSGSPSVNHFSLINTPYQVMAEKLQDFIILQKGLDEYPLKAVEEAVRVLEADVVDRSEKALGIAKWLLSLYKIKEMKGKNKRNLLWKEVALAPPGFCHIRSTMISTLLDDIIAGYDFETVKRRWNNKMHPLQYQRPTTVKEGNIKRAEELVEKMGIKESLNRRFAKLEDIQALWVPTPTKLEDCSTSKERRNVFDHIRATDGKSKEIKSLELPAKEMSWSKFRSHVLQEAKTIECLIPSAKANFFAFVTASDPTAPNILQWDNPVSWFLYVGGSRARTWNLTSMSYVKVNTIALNPAHWNDENKYPHQTEAAHFILEGARNVEHTYGGLFFPETIRNEYREIRSVLEAHSNKTLLAGRDEATACGIVLQKGSSEKVTLKVNGKDVYLLDRWE